MEAFVRSRMANPPVQHESIEGADCSTVDPMIEARPDRRIQTVHRRSEVACRVRAVIGRASGQSRPDIAVLEHWKRDDAEAANPGWGHCVVEQIAKYLRATFPGTQGFSLSPL
jgi:hypothetical protein